jgi:hypothetical protein
MAAGAILVKCLPGWKHCNYILLLPPSALLGNALQLSDLLVSLDGNAREIRGFLVVDVLVNLLEERAQLIGRRRHGFQLLNGHARIARDAGKPLKQQEGLVFPKCKLFGETLFRIGIGLKKSPSPK